MKTMKELRNEHVLNALIFHRGNRTRICEDLEISVRTLRNWINEMRADGLKIASALKISKNEKLRKLEKEGGVTCMPSNEERIFYADNPDKVFYRKN